MTILPAILAAALLGGAGQFPINHSYIDEFGGRNRMRKGKRHTTNKHSRTRSDKAEERRRQRNARKKQR